MDTNLILGLLVALPSAVAFAIIITAFRSHEKIAAALSIGAIGISFVAGCLLLALNHAHMEEAITYKATWLSSAGLNVTAGILLDPLSLVMIFVVTLVSLLVQVYSLGYMSGDPGKARFYAFLSLFTWSMLGLTIAPNMLQTYIFWEMVGLCSYLLIGFWYEKPSASAAAKKAFVMTRFGDLGFFAAVVLLTLLFGSLEYSDLTTKGLQAQLAPFWLTAIGLLTFFGVMGKSAQFPLHAWLPDAMEGPTPVSALIHAATMVVAGVYLLARNYALFASSDITMTTVLIIGTVTAFMGATMAMVQRDIKKIIAYSTISHLGMMVMAIGAGGMLLFSGNHEYAELGHHGYAPGIFHLFTHGMFKALLFLCAGSLIHKFGTNDLFDIARGGGRTMPVTFVTLIIGALAAAGIFPFAGFWSKDSMFALVWMLDNKIYYAAAMVITFLSAYYCFRLVFVLGFSEIKPAAGSGHGDDHGSGHAAHHGKESPANMWVPLAILAALSVGVGFIGSPLMNSAFFRYLVGAGEHMNYAVVFTSLTAGLLGVGVAFADYARPQLARDGFLTFLSPLHMLFVRLYYVDDFYQFVVHRIVIAVSGVLDWFDKSLVNGAVNATGLSTLFGGRVMSSVQTGAVQVYIAVMFTIVVGIVSCFVLR